MEKKSVVRVTVVFLLLSLLVGAAIPVHAADQPMAELTWQKYIESITPVGDEPSLTLELTPTGYIFIDYSIPREYDVVFQNGTTARVRIPRRNELEKYSDGKLIGSYFDVDAGGETLTLFAQIVFDAQTKQSVFQLGQQVPGQIEIEGNLIDVLFNRPFSEEPCRTEIDDSSLIARILYPFYAVFERIVEYFIELRYSLANK